MINVTKRSSSDARLSSTRISGVYLRNEKAIGRLDLTFEDDVTVIAGPNGIGKSTILDTMRRLLTTQAMRMPHERVKRGDPSNDFSTIALAGDDLSYGYSPTGLRILVTFDESRTGGIADFASWWDARDIAHARVVRDTLDPSYRDPELALFTDAFESVNLIKGTFKPDPAMVGGPSLLRDGVTISWNALSSGERAVITTIGNIAKRGAEQLGEKSIAVPLIVFIDEIDLHLHPRWQRAIVPALLEAFPTYQFVVTTHSPQVVGSVEARCIRLLSKADNGEHLATIPAATKGIDSNFILDALMEAEDRDPTVAKEIDRFLRDISEDNIEEATRTYEKISSLIEGDSDPVVARLRFQLSIAASRRER